MLIRVLEPEATNAMPTTLQSSAYRLGWIWEDRMEGGVDLSCHSSGSERKLPVPVPALLNLVATLLIC